MLFISTINDPDGVYLGLINKVEKNLFDIFGNKTTISFSSSTDQRVISKLQELGIETLKGGMYGEGKLTSLRKATQHSVVLFYIDFDKILHWLLHEEQELLAILQDENYIGDNDLVLFGRTNQAMDTYPESWIKTESIANKLVSEIYNRKLDIYTGTVMLSRHSQELILKESSEKGWGSCIEWPLLPISNNLKYEYVEVNGLSWEDPDRINIKENTKEYDQWYKINYESIDEWKKRTEFLLEQVKVIQRLTK